MTSPQRSWLRVLATGLIALLVMIVPSLADELIGYISKVDVAAKKLTVMEKGTDKEVLVTVTDDTEFITNKGSSKGELAKIEKNVARAKDKNGKGILAEVTHDKGVASKVRLGKKKDIR